MKQITIVGNLGSNAVQRTTADGRDIMSFSVAVNDRRGDTTWFNCVGTYRAAQFEYLTKGQCVCVCGDLTVGEYNGRPDMSVSVDRLELCGRAKDDQSDTTQP